MNSTAVAQYNAKLAIVSSFLADLTFILPIWLLYSLHVLHLQPTLAIAIFMSIWIGSAVLEVPTGALADRLGRKKIFIVGQLLFALYPLAYAFKVPVALLIMTCLVSALGSAMRSGALLPVVHSSFKQAGIDEEKYERFLSINQMATFIARALTGVLGAWLYTLNPTWPFFAMFVVTFLNFMLGFLIRDAPVEAKISRATNLEHIRHTFSAIREVDVVVAVIVAFGLLSVASETIWTGYQVFFTSDGRSAFLIGVLFSVIAVCSTLGAYGIRFVIRKLQPVRLLELYGVAIIATAFLLFQPNHTVRLLAILPMGVGSGTTLFVLNATIQKNIANRYHATALSIVSFVQYAVYGIGSLLFGLLLQVVGASKTRIVVLVMALVSFGAVLLYSIYRKRLLDYSIDA